MSGFSSLIIILIAFSAIYGFINPNINAISDLKAKQTEYRDAIDKTKEIENMKNSLLARYNSFPKADKDRLDKMLPSKEETASLINDIDSIASSYGMAVKTVITTSEDNDTATSIVEGAPRSPYRTTSVSFYVSGSYPNLVNFLNDLEKSLRIMDIRSIELSTNSTTASVNSYLVKLDIYSLN